MATDAEIEAAVKSMRAIRTRGGKVQNGCWAFDWKTRVFLVVPLVPRTLTEGVLHGVTRMLDHATTLVEIPLPPSQGEAIQRSCSPNRTKPTSWPT